MKLSILQYDASGYYLAGQSIHTVTTIAKLNTVLDNLEVLSAKHGNTFKRYS